MIYKTFYLFLIIASPVIAQVGRDSAKTSEPSKMIGEFHAEEVRISRMRWTGQEILNWRVQTVRPVSELIKITGSSSLGSALGILHPSLDVRSYGTQSGIALASFRGLPPEYTTVYRDGIRINNEQHQLADLSKFAVRWAKDIEIVSGVNAGILGGDIGGAAINITTDHPIEKAKLEIYSGTNSYDDLTSFGEKEIAAHTLLHITESIGLSAGGSYNVSNGKFPFFQNTTKSTIERENNNSYLTTLDIAPSLHFGEDSYLRMFSTYTESERGVPGAVTTDFSGASAPFARQYDRDFISAASFSHNFTEETFGYASASYQSQYETYTDPLIHIADEYLNQIYSTALRFQYRYAANSRFTAGASYTKNILTSNQNISADNTKIGRDHISLSALEVLSFENGFGVNASANLEHISDRKETKLLPSIAFRYDSPSTNLIFGVQAAFGTFYHPPSFNALYWKVGGNAGLRSENGMTGEVSANYEGSYILGITDSRYKMKGAVFYTRVHDQIVWMPSPKGIWTPNNVQEASSKGAEVTFSFAAPISTTMSIDLTQMLSYTSVTNLTEGLNYGKELPYSVPFRLVTTATIEHTIGSFSGTFRYRSPRNTDAGNNETTRLPSVSTIDLFYKTPMISLFSSLPTTVELGVSNITNVQYAEIPNFPQPGRMIKLGIQFSTN